MYSLDCSAVNFYVALFPQRPEETLSMSLTYRSRLPGPHLRTSMPFVITARVVPDTPTASSPPLVSVISAASERPSTVWSRGTLCAAVVR